MPVFEIDLLASSRIREFYGQILNSKGNEPHPVKMRLFIYNLQLCEK
ncbi:hypothetical protein B425_0807 [Bacillus amyloliquefaciens]|nr:hypothetical protein LL3_00851 [Bacillus amyloliquefaciens LL3]KYC96126.1 hypothetical protein B425_0807 [Bacillus amyloliquefaciens]